MDIFSKSTMVEFTIADMINLANDATRLEVFAKLMADQKDSKMIIDVASSLTDILERIEESFNSDEEGS